MQVYLDAASVRQIIEYILHLVTFCDLRLTENVNKVDATWNMDIICLSYLW